MSEAPFVCVECETARPLNSLGFCEECAPAPAERPAVGDGRITILHRYRTGDIKTAEDVLAELARASSPDWHYKYLQQEIAARGGVIDPEDGHIVWPSPPMPLDAERIRDEALEEAVQVIATDVHFDGTIGTFNRLIARIRALQSAPQP